jgi:hypothetical protein
VDVKSFRLEHRRLVLVFAPVVAVGLAVLLTLAAFGTPGVSGHLSHSARRPPATSDIVEASPSASNAAGNTVPGVVVSPGPPESSASRGATPVTDGLPVTPDPRQYAIAYATALFSYDTRAQTESAWAAVLTAGLDSSADVRADNTRDLADRMPPTAVWNTMASSAQHATFTLNRAWVPQLWAQNASQYPAGAVAITVSGTQDVVWADGASQVPQSVTLLLLCPPYNDACVVNRIAAQVLR